jgi:hypothetical protein
MAAAIKAGQIYQKRFELEFSHSKRFKQSLVLKRMAMSSTK